MQETAVPLMSGLTPKEIQFPKTVKIPRLSDEIQVVKINLMPESIKVLARRFCFN